MGTNNNKVIIFGLDGCNWKILTPAIEKGYMPFLKSLVDNGSSGILKSTIPAITPAAWGSFLTGVKPEKNNVFNFSYWDKKTKQSHFVNSTHLQKTFAQIASNHNKNVSLINVPMTYPPQEINGYVVSGILTPSTNIDFTFPKDFKVKILEEIPTYHIFNIKDAGEGHPFFSPKNFIKKMIQIIEMRHQLAEMVLEKQPHDIFMLHFQCCDVLQHALWPYLDSTHKLHKSEIHDIIMRDFYGLIDEKMAAIHNKFSQINHGNILTLIASDHGFEAHNKRVNLGRWLLDKGYLVKNKNKKLNPLKKITKRLHIGRMLRKVFGDQRINALEKAAHFSGPTFDWDKTYAFSIGRSGEGAIYILDKNNPAKTAQLINDLENLYDHEANLKISEKILTKEQLYGSDAPDIFPDITIIPATGYTFTGSVGNESELLKEVTPENDFHLGKHHEDGIVVFAGSNVKTNNNLNINITDITPTILNFLEIPIPKLCDGKVASEAFIAKKTSLYSNEQASNNLNRSNDRDIQDRLRDLGYM